MKSKRIVCCLTAVVTTCATWGNSPQLHAGVNSAADFTIHPLVVAPNPPRIGFNLSQSTDIVDITNNAWLVDGGFSSYDLRQDFLATDNGAANGTTFISTDVAKFGTDYYNSLVTGNAFVGALARVYRFNTSTNVWTLVRTGTVQSYTAVSGSNLPADHTITFTTTGAQTLAGDVIWLSRDAVYQNPDISQWITNLPSRLTFYAAGWNPEGAGSFGRTPVPCTYIRVTDVPSGQTNGQSSAPPMSIKITTTATSGTAGIWQYLQVGGTGNEQFEPGHTYNVSVNLKQTGIASGTATFICGPVSYTFTGITGTWQNFTYSFPAPATLGGPPAVRMDYTAPGTLYVNQFQLSDSSHAAFTLDPRALSTFQSFNPGSIRIWSAFSSNGSSYDFWSVDSLLQAEGTDRGNPEIGTNYYGLSIQNKLPNALALAKQLNANPWLICNMSWSEQEWSNFIDYLAAPAGVGYAVNRPASHPGPYTADFSTIYLEFGNEEWGTQETFVNGDYGQWAHYMFNQAVAGKSYFNPSQIKLILTNFTQNDSFGVTALANCPEAQSLDYYLYTGSSSTGDAGFQQDLLSIAGYMSPINTWISAEQTSAAAGHPYEVTSYEGGNGSDDPNGGSGQGDNSLAAAVGQLDVYLYAEQAGMTALNFFLYKLGVGTYSSHTNFANGYIPHPVWEAMSMRNNYCAGSIVSTTTNVCPATTDGNNTPLVGVYSFHDTTANKADIVVISRDLNNTTPVTLHLPTSSTGSVTLYTLTGDPRANNDTTLTVPIATQSIASFGKTYTFSMPAGSVYLFQVPTSATWPGIGPTGLVAGSGSGYAQLSWNPNPTATSYKVYRGTSATTIGTTAYATGLTTPNYVDTGVTTGSTYYYVVSAVTAAGETDTSAQASVKIIAPGSFLDINCGGTAISGSNWVADVDYSGGFTQSNATQTVPATLVNPAPAAVYQTLRGGGTYSIPGLTPGAAYTVRIHGDEPFYTSAGHRIADVIINGQTVETGLDWYAVAGGQNVAAARTYSLIENSTGTLTVKFVADPHSLDGNVDFSGIEVSAGSVPLPVTPSSITVTPGTNQATLNWAAVPQAVSYTILYGTSSGTYTQAVSGITTNSKTITGLITGQTYYFTIAAVNAAGPSPFSPEVNSAASVIAINCGGTAVSGTKWIADVDFSGNSFTQTEGTQVIPSFLVNPAPQGVYQTIRAGGIYTIPGMTPGATYIVRIHGEEPFYNVAGKRLANVTINGTVVETALDWFAAAGGENVAAIRTYTVVQPAGSTSMTVQMVKNPNSPDGNVEMSGIEILKP